MSQGKRRETKQQPRIARTVHQFSCCLVFLHFMCDTLRPRMVPHMRTSLINIIYMICSRNKIENFIVSLSSAPKTVLLSTHNTLIVPVFNFYHSPEVLVCGGRFIARYPSPFCLHYCQTLPIELRVPNVLQS